MAAPSGEQVHNHDGSVVITAWHRSESHQCELLQRDGDTLTYTLNGGSRHVSDGYLYG